MKELTELMRTWRELPPGTPTVLATVVATSGSTYRRPGARMLLTPDGWAAGSISGGCLEGDLVQSAFARTANGPALVTYDATSDEDILWGFGLGCNGIVEVLLERLPADGGVLRQIAEAIDRRQPLTLATVVSAGPDLGKRVKPPPLVAGCSCPTEAEGVRDGDPEALELFQETIYPPRPIVIFGAGHDVIPLVSAAKALGWHVTVVDHRASYADPARFPGADAVLVGTAKERLAEFEVDERTAVVVMAHNYLKDLATLRQVLPSAAGYVGLLGPVKRSGQILQDLRGEGLVLGAEEMARFHSPIGLDLGADGPDEVALAIVAEIQAYFAGRTGGHLTPKPHKSEAPACARLA